MNETAWLNATDASGMLKLLRRRAVGWHAVLPGRLAPSRPLPDRQVRLFGVACCRSLGPLPEDQLSRGAVCVAERYAQGQASADELCRVRSLLLSQPGVRWWRGWLSRIYAFQMHEARIWAQGMAWAVAADPDDLWRQITRLAWVVGPNGPLQFSLELEDGSPSPAALLRDIFGNPFRAKPAITEAVLCWNDRCIVKLAACIDEEGDFSSDRMGLLADALEEAGVTDEAMLGHCRPGGVHVRGCWLVDLLTRRE
jgi:hypothetical protein